MASVLRTVQSIAMMVTAIVVYNLAVSSLVVTPVENLHLVVFLFYSLAVSFLCYTALCFLCMIVRKLNSLRFYYWKQPTLRRHESVKEGSPIFTRKVPDNVVGVYVRMKDDTDVYQGSGFRVDDWIVVPEHVIMGRVVYISHKGKVVDRVDPKHWKEIATDVVAVSVNDYTKFRQVAKSKIRPAVGRPYVTVQCYKPAMNAALGTVRPVKDGSFGQVEFTGSTVPGFSGGCYEEVGTVYGMHLGGGAINYGVSASFLLMRLQRLAVAKPEHSSLAAIKQAFMNLKDKDDWSLAHTGSPGEYELRVGDSYHWLDQDQLNEVYADEWLEQYMFEDDGDRRLRKRGGRKGKHRGGEDRDDRFWKESTAPETVVPVSMEEMYAAMQTLKEELLVAIHSSQRQPERSESPVSSFATAGSNTGSEMDHEELREDDEPVLEMKPESIEGSFLGKEAGDAIVSRLEYVEATLNSQVSQIQEIILGQAEMRKRFSDHLLSMQDWAEKQEVSLRHQIVEKSTALFTQLSSQIMSDITGLSSQVSQVSTSISTVSSELSSLKARVDSAPSQGSQGSGTRSAGMEQSLQKYKEWRTSNPSSSPNFIQLRDQFLASLNLSRAEQAKLVKNYTNWWKGKEYPRRKRQLEDQMIAQYKDQCNKAIAEAVTQLKDYQDPH